MAVSIAAKAAVLRAAELAGFARDPARSIRGWRQRRAIGYDGPPIQQPRRGSRTGGRPIARVDDRVDDVGPLESLHRAMAPCPRTSA